MRAEEKRNAAFLRQNRPDTTKNKIFGVDFGSNLVIILMDINLH